MVLIGNSLGGAVALRAAWLLKGRAISVVWVNTLHDATQEVEPAEAKPAPTLSAMISGKRAGKWQKRFFIPGNMRSFTNG